MTTSASSLLRALLVYGLCLPLAAFLGYLLATPLDPTTFVTVGIVLFTLTVPLFLRWHHPWLIASWNMSAVLFFLPGRPYLWMGLAGISLLIAILQYTLNRDRKLLSVPSVTMPLVFLSAVVLITAQMTGGFGLRSFGSDVNGGKRYFLLLAAIIGYFAIASRKIPPQRGGLYVALFFLGYATMAIGNVAGLIGPSMNFLFLFFPVEGFSQGNAVSGPVDVLSRSSGLMMMSLGVCCALFAKYNLRGLFDLRHPYRLPIFLLFLVAGMFGGFRSLLVQMMMMFAILFLVEGLFRSRALPVVLLATILGGAFVVGFATRLPLSVQRTLAFLPIEIDPAVKINAQYSTDWRLKMWEDVLPEVPRYLILGKGYGFSQNDVDLAVIAARGRAGTEGAELVGDYHNGPLSVVLTFGIFGAICFGWFIVSCIRVLHRNYKFGDPQHQRLNTFLFAFFLAKVLFFVLVFGSFYMDMATFTGIIGLSVSLNGGVASRQVLAPEAESPVADRFRLSPGVRKPVGV